MKTIALTSLFALSMAQAYDFKPVLEQGESEVAVEAVYLRATSYYDSDSKNHKYPNGGHINQTILSPSFKYGVIPGLEVMAALGYAFGSAGDDDSTTFDENGLSQPIVGAKLGLPETPIRFSVFFELPLGAKKIVGTHPTLNTHLAAIYSMQQDNIEFNAALEYVWYPENKDKYDRGNEINVILEPLFVANETIKMGVEAQLATANTDAYDGEDWKGSSSYLLMAGPKGIYSMGNTVMEASIPISWMGKNSLSYWGVDLKFSQKF